jgi:hypothetical protein
MATIKKACKGTLYPKSSSVSKKLKAGGNLGMTSVNKGFDKNPGVTRADVILKAKENAGQAKKGMNLKKQAATAIAMKAAGKKPKAMMKAGGKMKKCAYGCK